MSGKSDVELCRLSARMGAKSSPLLERPAFAKLLATTLRADLIMAETQEHVDDPIYAGRVLALGGSDDPVVRPADIAAWEDATSASCTVRILQGGDFYALENPADTVSEVVLFVESDVAAMSGVARGSEA